jgi:SnoaL-like protein
MTSLAEDRDAIRDLFARYCLYVDSGAAQEWAATFTEDGVFVVSLPAGALHHMVINEAIDVDGDTAVSRSSVFVTSKGAVVTTGRSEDELRRIDGTWRIAHRTYVADPQ